MNLNLSKKTIYPSLFLTLCLVGLYNPLSNLKIESFNRIMGHGLLNGINITKRINNFYLWIIILFPIAFLFCYSLIKFVYKKNKCEEAFDFIYTVSCCGFIPLTFCFMTKFVSEKNLFSNFSISIITIIILTCLIFSIKNINMKFDTFKWILIVSLSLFPLYTFINFNFMFLINVLVIFLLSSKLEVKRLQLAFLPLIYGGFILSICFETINILNQYSIFISKLIVFLVVYILLILACIFIYVKKKTYNFNWQKNYYIALILSFSFIMVQPELQNFVGGELFESANHGLAINDFFKYNKIPLIETFDAHMVYRSFWGIIYGILNNDIFGAMFIIYSKYDTVIKLLILYKILTLCFDYDFSFFTILLFPTNLPILWSDFSLISVIILIFTVKINKFYSYLIYWISLVVICLYKLDMGFAFSMATLVSYIVLYLFDRKLNLKYFIVSFIPVIFSCLCIYIAICFFKNINPISRILEFLALSMSNINWAYNNIGDTKSTAFIFCYCIVPFTVLSITIFILYQLKIYKLKKDALIILLSLGLAYLFNLQRGLVRHSLAEKQFNIVLFCAIILISITIAYIKNRKELFIFVFLGLTIFVNVLRTNSILDSSVVLDASLNKYKEINLKTSIKQKVQRVIFDDKDCKEIIDTLNKVLNDDETYIDFTNQTLLYALSNKEKPVYINQSPAHLSGEYSQIKFIEQIENNPKIKLALMPSKTKSNKPAFIVLDELCNNYRYYKVVEYIYNNFYPAFEVGDYSLWYRGNKEDCLYGDIDLHSYYIRQIPYVWGMYDTKKSYLNKEIQSMVKRNDYYIFDSKNVDKSKGNYIMLELDSDVRGTCDLSMGILDNDFKKFNNFNFYLNKGNNRYLIRVSTDYYWYNDKINAININSDIDISNIKVSLLEGD